MCLYPRLIKNRKYTKTKKNGGIIPAITDERVKYVPIGCQNCIECRKQKRRAWQIRLQEDIKTHTNGKFITLTFSNESIWKISQHKDIQELQGYERDNSLATKATRLFLERWRKKYKKSLRHWLVTELGHTGTENIHLHGIIWTDLNLDNLDPLWQYGYIWKGKGEKKINYVNQKTVNYIIKYITKQDEKHPGYKSKILTTPGIGHNWILNPDHKKNLYNEKNTYQLYRTNTGHEMSLPIYYRNKIYTEEQREKLWLQLLDKNERWICGEKTNSWDVRSYYKLLQHYRRINLELGYGTDEINWNQQQYEEQKRNLLYEKRTEKYNTRHHNHHNLGNNNTHSNNNTCDSRRSSKLDA